MFACQAGAKKVYAVEMDNVIEIAKETVQENGFSDRVEFIYGDVNQIELPEKVDAIITNTGLLGTLNNLPSARDRFLKNDGALMPNKISYSFVPAQNEAFYQSKIASWQQEKFGLKFNSFHRYAANQPVDEHFERSDFLSEPVTFAGIDLTHGTPGNYHWNTRYEVTRDGMFHGLVAWYALQLSPSVSLSTEPPLALASELWWQPFIPSEKATPVKEGDVISAEIGYYHSANPWSPYWKWSFEINGVRTEQTSFDSIPLSKQFLAKLSPETQVPETQVPETQVPETQVPETQVPETQVPQAQIPIAG